jgi:hypothetical protein
MKLTALELAVISDTLNHSLTVKGWFGFTEEARIIVRDKVISIMEEMSVKVITDKPNFTIDADAGI